MFRTKTRFKIFIVISNLCALFLLVFSSVAMAAPQDTTNNASAAKKSQTYALMCQKKDTSVKIIGGKSLGCTSNGKDTANQVTVQGVGSKSDSVNEYPNTVELTIVSATCTGAGNAPVSPKVGSEITSIKCSKGGSASISKKSVIKPTKNPSKSVEPYTLDDNGNTVKVNGGKVSSKEVNKENCDKDPGNALCAPDSGICSGGRCQDAAADPNVDCNKQGCDFIKKYVNPGINLFSALFGIVAVCSLIFGGIQYSAAGADPQKITNAKKRITDTIIAIVAYFFLYAFINFLVPGGLF